MPIPQKIVKFLEAAKIKYEPINHRTVYTAYDKARTLRVPEKIVGKTLVVRLDRNVGLVLIPANRNLDKGKLKKVVKPPHHNKFGSGGKAKKIDFVSERVIKNKLKGVKVGAVPPFGTIWKLPTFIDRGLMKSPKIIINAGDYNWSVKISGASLKKLVPDLVAGTFGKAR